MTDLNDYPIDFETWPKTAQQAYINLLQRTIKAERQRTWENIIPIEQDETDTQISWRALLFKILSELAIAAATLDIDVILQAITCLAADAIDATSAYVCDWDAERMTITILSEYISPKASQREQASDLGVTYHVGEAHMEKLLHPQRYWVSHYSDPDMPDHIMAVMETYGAKSILYAPMTVQDEVIGYIEIWETRYERQFTQREIDLIKAIAQRAAVVVRNAQLHQIVKESEARHRLLVETMSEGVVQVDANGRIVFVNDAFCQLIGFAIDDVLTCDFRTLLRDQLYMDDLHLQALHGNSIQEVQVVTQVGVGIWVQISQSLMVDRHEQPAGVVYVWTDITERKQSAERAIQLQLEQERIQLLAEFIQNASHEFYTPLSIIRTSLYLLSKSEKHERYPDYIANVENQIDVIADLVKALVLMTSLDSVANVSITPTYVNQLVQSAVHRVEETARKKSLVITSTIEESGIFLLVNADRMLIALTNVLDNAVRYTPEGGQIAITAHRVGDDDFVCLRVSDTGVGIAKADQARVFERFYRHDDAHTTRGFGLGLPIAKRIIELHGGKITVDSDVGQGASFCMTVPALPAKSSSLT